MSIIDKEQHQETVVIDTEISVSRRKGLRFRKPVTFGHTMSIILTQMYVNKELKLCVDNISSSNGRSICRWLS